MPMPPDPCLQQPSVSARLVLGSVLGLALLAGCQHQEAGTLVQAPSAAAMPAQATSLEQGPCDRSHAGEALEVARRLAEGALRGGSTLEHPQSAYLTVYLPGRDQLHPVLATGWMVSFGVTLEAEPDALASTPVMSGAPHPGLGGYALPPAFSLPMPAAPGGAQNQGGPAVSPLPGAPAGHGAGQPAVFAAPLTTIRLRWACPTRPGRRAGSQAIICRR